MTVRVFLWSKLSDDPYADELKAAFKTYKGGNDPDGVFGKDSPYGRPVGAWAVELQHVHVLDEDERHDQRNELKNERTSDGCVVYTRGEVDKEAYCILAVFPEDAHRLAKSDKIMKPLIEAARKFRERY